MQMLKQNKNKLLGSQICFVVYKVLASMYLV